ncbi:MAG: T9SS type A sorting domain-containing protein [Muribaculaceae bacterium]|nr:T9SS type A sorting domain-containing protein [Muribaculaceae bacterium]
MSGIGASADLYESVIVPMGTGKSNYTYVIPNLAQDDKNGFYITNRSQERVNTLAIYDDNINLVKDFSVELIPFTTKTYSQQKVVVALDLVNIRHTGSFSTLAGVDHLDLSLQLVKSMHGDQAEIATLPNGQQVIAYSYAYQNLFGHKYPYEFYMQTDDPKMNGYFEECTATYDTVMGFDPNSEVRESEYTYYNDLTEVKIIPEDGGDNGWHEITRGIFSDDYTYILPIPEQVPFTEGGGDNDSYKGWGTQTKVKGFVVYDTNQKLVQTISFPANHYQSPDDNSISYVVLSGKKYIFIKTSNSDETEAYCLIYRLEGQNKLNLVATAPIGKVSPRAPRQGEMVTVEIDERFSNEKCLVNVVSSDGRNFIQETINPGENSITFNTSNLPQGIYVVNISGKIGKIETSKIIVR